MSKKSLFISGSSGQIGSFLANALESQYDILGMDLCASGSYNHAVNALNEEDLCSFFEKHKHLNVAGLINCIGNPNTADKTKSLTIDSVDLESFSNMLDANLTSVFLLMKSYCKYFGDKPSNIINLSSLYSVVSPRLDLYGGGIKHPGYVAAKFGLIGLSKYFAVLYAKNNIKVNCLAPAAVLDTKGVDEKFLEKYLLNCPMGKGVSLHEIHNFVNVLLNNDTMTGQNLVIDAGYTLW